MQRPSISNNQIDKLIIPTQCNDMIDLCKPLKELEVSFFHYQETHPNGRRICLTNNSQWMQHFFTSQIYLNGFFQKHPSHYNAFSFLRSEIDLNKPILDDRDHFGISNQGITIARPFCTHLRLYFFAGTCKSPKTESYFREIHPLLENFISYFHIKGKKLLQDAYRYEVMLPFASLCNEHDSLENTTNADKFNMQLRSKLNYYLSNKEKLIINGYVDGKNAKQIAHDLKLSSRTVEWYTMKLKDKFEAKNLYMLVHKLTKSGLI